MKSSVSKSSPVARLRAVARGSQGFSLASAAAHVEVTALAPDLLRLRVARGKAASPPPPSWAVVKRDWPAVACTVKVTKAGASLATAVGKFTVNLKTGAWEVRDAGGLRLFTAAAGATAFGEAKAEVALDLTPNESLFGLGETTGTFNRRGQVREFWNIDVLGHAPAIHPGLKSLYVSIPFALSLREGRAAGLFWDNPAKQTWDLGQTQLDRWQMSADSGELDLYLFLGPTAEGICARYAELTGPMPLPPLWGLGYQQCRYSYETRERLEEVAREFRRRALPCDVLYLDIHHMDGYRVFTFGKGYPKPAEMLAKLAKQGFKVVTIVDPGVKDDPKFGVLKRGVKQDAFVKQADGSTDFLGEVWPGAARFPDFLNAKTREWWGDEQQALQAAGVAGFWNDMNEPANFARPDKTLAPDAQHRTDAGPLPHTTAHNLYGMQMARASRDGALKHRPDERPFVITRAGYAGIQRHALVWTGDNSSNWDHLNDAVQMFLNLSLSGVPFCGGDVGGFMENTTPELFTRWFQFATFTPFFRNHSNLGTIAQEPWALGEPVEQICREFLGLRYQLLPYLYSLFAEARATGAPIMRPLLWHHQNDPVAVACGDQFLLGRGLLVAPILRQGAVARSVYLPNDLWYDFWTGEQLVGGRHVVAEAPPEIIPLYVRAGTILPLAEPQQFVGETPMEVINLHVWPHGRGQLDWYEDDGATQAYEQGAWSRRTITSFTRGKTLTVTFGAVSGTFESRIAVWRLVVWSAKKPARLKVNGRPAEGSFNADTGVFIADLGNFDGEFSLELVGV
jgi:alpha-glucosidase